MTLFYSFIFNLDAFFDVTKNIFVKTQIFHKTNEINFFFSGKQFLLDPEIDHGDKLHAQNTGDEHKHCQLKGEATLQDDHLCPDAMLHYELSSSENPISASL